MNRKIFTASLAAFPLLIPAGVAAQKVTKTKSNPNIVFILADDLGYGDIGCYGQNRIETPNIDALAQAGMLFTNHYSGSPVSAPSRSVLLTGMHSGHTYIRGNDEMAERGDVWNHQAMLQNPGLEGQRPLPAGTITIPLLLKRGGYTTACIGKWGLGYPGSEGEPNKMGIDLFYGYNCQRQAHTYFPPFLYRNTKREYLSNKLLPPGTKLDEGANPFDPASYEKYTQKEYSPDLMYNEILSFVEANRNNPFMLLWTTPVPHVPLQAPKRWVDYYLGKYGDEKPYTGGQGYFPTRYPHATYAAMISHFDEQIGGLIEKLKQLGIYENTVVVFTSDNGPTFNGGTDSPWFDSAKPFKSEYGWGKTSLREGGIRVPLIISWPQKIKAGSRSDLMCASWDFLPTFCELAGITSSSGDGISMVPTLLGRKQKEHQFLYWEYPEGSGSKAIRMGKWKGLILDIKKGNSTMLLYDLLSDPREQHDLSSQFPNIVEKLKELMKKSHIPSAVDKFEM